MLKLPNYLDSIGTVLVAILARLLAGALTRIFSNLLWGVIFSTPTIIPFALTAAAIGVMAGVLVLDETTAGQDGRGLALLGTLLVTLAQEGKTIVMIAHDMDFCAETCERLIVMGQGGVLAVGDKHAVFAQAELLAQTSVEPPQITWLAQALALSPGITTILDFLNALKT